MGRPKVPEDQRQRAVAACTACRAAKKKCSGSFPCIYCQHRGTASSCSLNLKARFRAPKSNEWSSPIGSSPPPVDSTALIESSRTGTKHTLESKHEGSRTREKDEPDLLPRPRMLRNLQGEQVYIGRAASLSYLQLVREIVAERIGPSQFSHNDYIENMLEAKSPISVSTSIQPLDIQLDVDRMLILSEIFNAAVDGFMGIFAPSELEGLLIESNGPYAPYRNPHKEATIDLIVAIGAQCESYDSANDIGQKYFRRAQQLAVSQILEDPSVDMVRAFLLMAFYMLGNCRRNAAFMYIGVATRAAVALGLHSRESYLDMRLPKFQLRLRIWVSLCNLDMVTSAILGRPAATTALRSDLEMSYDEMAAASENTELDMTALMASYRILSIISDIVDKMYKRKFITGALMKTYLDEIEAWKREYGKVLTSNGPLDSSVSSSAGTIGSVHVSCLYYFAVTLVTRPILIPSLSSQSGSYSPSWSEMAQACVDAATYLVQTCVEAQEAGLLLGNMCILKALVFIAGLILGLQSFCNQRIDLDVETAFSGAQRYLEFLSTQSPQAGHYLEILSLLSTAITRQRQSLASAGRSKYVSRLFKVNTTEVEGVGMKRKRVDYTRTKAASISTRESVIGGYVNEESQAVRPDEDILFNWEHLDLTQWDDFLSMNTIGAGSSTSSM